MSLLMAPVIAPGAPARERRKVSPVRRPFFSAFKICESWTEELARLYFQYLLKTGASMTAMQAPPQARPSAQQQLRTAQDLFIRRWGEMGQTWGINRTMAEIHALLYITGQPLCTDDVMERLNISRGNASMSLRALCDWGIIRRMHKRGERREYFESLGDVWEMFSIIAAERKRREMDPVLETIRQCQLMLNESSLGKSAARQDAVQLTRQRLAGMEEFMEVTNKIFQQFISNARSGLTRVVKVLLKAF
jgi:HTH-type transcriptional regulator, glycine betaine synthesis regulator